MRQVATEGVKVALVLVRAFVHGGMMLTPCQWVRPALTVILCIAAIVLLWYGAGALFDHDPTADTGSLAEH